MIWQHEDDQGIIQPTTLLVSGKRVLEGPRKGADNAALGDMVCMARHGLALLQVSLFPEVTRVHSPAQVS